MRCWFWILIGAATAYASILACSSSYATSPDDADGGEAGTDAVIPDGTLDETSTPPPPPDAAGLFPCATNTTSTLCADFDGNDLKAGWDGVEQNGVQTLAVDSTMSVSAPASLHARIDQVLGANASGTARLEKAIPADAKRTRVSFDVATAVPVLGSGQFVSLVEFLCGNAATFLDGAWLQYHFADGGTVLQARAKNGVLRQDLPPLPTASPFVRVTLDVTWSAAGANLTVFYDSAVVAGLDATGMSCASNPPFRLVLGLSTDHIGPEAHYDNVIYDLDPK